MIHAMSVSFADWKSWAQDGAMYVSVTDLIFEMIGAGGARYFVLPRVALLSARTCMSIGS